MQRLPTFHRDALDLHRDALIEAHWRLPPYDMSHARAAGRRGMYVVTRRRGVSVWRLRC